MAAKRLFRIQYVSDLHLEHYDKLAFPLLLTPAARYLALAGDIGHPRTTIFKSFIDYAARNWDRVYYVAGNHEYYAKRQSAHWKYNRPDTMFEIQKQIKEVCAPYSNVSYLHNDLPSVYLHEDNVAVVGATLWTHIPEDFKINANSGMNDYNLIPVNDDGKIRRLSCDDTNSLHAQEVEALEAQIDYWGSQKTQVCVITHHMPSYELISPRYADSPFNCCFASRLERLMKPHVRAWIYGHTHNAATSIVGNTICAVNARGYPYESVPGFSREAWLEFPTSLENSGAHNDELACAAAGIRSPFATIGAATTVENVAKGAAAVEVVEEVEEVEFI